MRILYLLILIIIGLNTISCATTPSPPPPPQLATQPFVKNKNPLAVNFYSDSKKISHPYKVIGTGSVSKFNTGGIKRQEANLRDALREIAAAMGGDAIINVSADNKNITGTVVSIEKNHGPNSNV